MNKPPSLDRDFLIPILIGGLSVVGIIVVLMIGRSLNAPAEVAATASATPFKYVYLGTEPAITTLDVEGSLLPPTEAPIIEDPNFFTPTRFSGSPPTLIILPGITRTVTSSVPRTGTPTRAITATRTNTPAAANTYDDTDSRLSYSGSWVTQNNVDGVYNNTLHISDVADKKSVTVQFSGQEIYFYYQSAASFGIVTICLDNDPLDCDTVNEAQGGGVWHHVFEESQTHIIKIEHTGSGSVNIDKFVIPAATPTPTRTPTSSP